MRERRSHTSKTAQIFLG